MGPDALQDAAQIQKEAQSFRRIFKSVIIATSSRLGEPVASYAPFILDDQGAVYVFVSQLARHTRHILENPRASLLWIEEETATRNIFARRRLSLDCVVTEIGQEDGMTQSILDRMERELGGTVSVLRSLSDFHLFKMEPLQGVFVQGFGRAFDVTGGDLTPNPDPKGPAS